MRIYISFDHDEIQKELPYEIIGETVSRGIWETKKRKRLFSAEFTEQERESCYNIIALSKKWLLKTGCPDEIKMTMNTYSLWHRLANFCYKL